MIIVIIIIIIIIIVIIISVQVHHINEANQQIAQLLLLPYHAPNNYNPVTRGEQGFGSTGDQVVCFIQQILSDRPTCQAKIQAKTFSEILDSRAISIITSPQW